MGRPAADAHARTTTSARRTPRLQGVLAAELADYVRPIPHEDDEDDEATTEITTTNREHKRHCVPASAAASQRPTGGHALPTSSVKHRSFWLQRKDALARPFLHLTQGLGKPGAAVTPQGRGERGQFGGHFFQVVSVDPLRKVVVMGEKHSTQGYHRISRYVP